MPKYWMALLALTLYIDQVLASRITCQTCKKGTSFDDCMKKAINYDCSRIGGTFTGCKVECNDKGEWKFGCTTPSQCTIQRRHCDNSGDCGITCCEGSLCLRNVTHTWCSEGLTSQASMMTIGACVLAGLFVR